MEQIQAELREDFERWKVQIGEDIYVGPNTVGILDVLRAHYLVIDFFATEYGEGVGGIGPKSLTMLHSTLSRQFSGYEHVMKWADNYHLCATLFWGLIKNHPFHDVNKRTALLTLFYHLIKVGRYPCSPPNLSTSREYERLAISIASNNLSAAYPRFRKLSREDDGDIHFVADFLRRNTRKLDKADYRITYHQLDAILRKHGYALVNPDRNQIELSRFQEEPVGLLGSKTRKVWKRVTSIGFPGWNRQVNVETVKKVRKLAYLTVEDGTDSDAFYHESDSLPALIPEFEGLLKRLSDR